MGEYPVIREIREAAIVDRPECPCCNALSDPRHLGTISYRDIWEALRSEWDANFSEGVIRSNTPSETTELVECVECGLQFFFPLAGGSDDFYRELGASPRYYLPWKWEFGWVSDRISPSMEVLDVGCGKGDFLSRIRPLARRAVGLEQNPSARVAAAERGIEVFGESAERFSEEHSGTFDAVCAFHVVEHIPDPVSFLRHLLACLKPGGALYVSVPNRARSYRAPREPLDCPPHHLTRWGPAQLLRLGALLETPVREFAFEPVETSIPWGDLRDRIRRYAMKMPQGEILGTWLSRIVPRVVFFPPFVSLYRACGMLERMGYYGGSMVARFARPS